MQRILMSIFSTVAASRKAHTTSAIIVRVERSTMFSNASNIRGQSGKRTSKKKPVDTFFLKVAGTFRVPPHTLFRHVAMLLNVMLSKKGDDK